MESRSAALRVGLFVLVGAIGVLALIFFLSGVSLHPGIEQETYFAESVQGLDVGTKVKFRGVTIGQVTDVGLVAAEYPPPDVRDDARKVYQQVVVRFRVNPKKLGHVDNVDNLIQHGLRVQIVPQGITGLSYLELTFVNPLQFPVQPVPWTPDSTVIPSIPSTLTQIQDAAEKVISSLSQVDLQKLVKEIGTLTNTLTEEVTTGDAHQALANAKTLLANLDQMVAATKLPQTSAAIRDLAAGDKTRQILDNLDKAASSLAKSSQQLPALIAASQSTIAQASETTADLQAELLPILQQLRSTVANLNALSASLSRNPAQVLTGPPPPPEGARQ